MVIRNKLNNIRFVCLYLSLYVVLLFARANKERVRGTGASSAISAVQMSARLLYGKSKRVFVPYSRTAAAVAWLVLIREHTRFN